MIQRIQTIHLLIGAALIGLFLGWNEAWSSAVATAVGERAGAVTIAVYVLGGIVAALALVATFFYKDRTLQSRLIGGALVADVVLVLVTLGAVGAGLFGSDVPITDAFGFQASAAILPVLAYLFLHLARRGVRRDIELVRSMDRLR